MRFIRNIGLGAICLLVITLNAQPAGALASRTATSVATPKTSGQALEIAPPLLYLAGSPGQTINAKIYLRDISNSPVIVTATTDDFVASGLDGTPKILLNQTTDDPYSIRSYIAPFPSLLLQPRQLKLLTITINIPANAAPGGHYGVFRFTATPQSLTGGNGVSLSASLGSLILLTVSGNIVQHLSVAKFDVTQNGHPSSFFQADPLTINEILKNDGNVHVQPIGLLTLKDMFGKKLAVMDINREQGNILPASERLFKEKIDHNVIGNHRMFGHYTAAISLSYGAKKQLVDHISFWVIPIKLIAILVIAIIGGFFLLRWLIKRYNQHIVDKAKKRK